MAQSKRSVQVWDCDHKSCEVRHYVEKSDPVPGLTGTVVNNDGSTGTVKWFACQDAHVLGAIEGALSFALEFEYTLGDQTPTKQAETVRYIDPGRTAVENDDTINHA
jgi:hypothetical protein